MNIVMLWDGWVDLKTREVHRPTPDRLTFTEAELLQYLCRRPGQTCNWRTLLSKVWGYHERARTRTTTATAHRLRAKIEVDPASPRHLQTVWGTGLLWKPTEANPETLPLLRLKEVNAALQRRVEELERRLDRR